MFGKLFDKFKGKDTPSAQQSVGAAPAQYSADDPAPSPSGRAGIGLCFNFQRGLVYESEYLFDVGMKQIFQTLRDLRVRATFHCPAKLCEIAPDQLATIRDQGHEIAMLGFEDEKVSDLTDDAVKQLVYSCRAAFARKGYQPIGWRSPHSGDDARLSEELARQNFFYSSEHDHGKAVYVLVKGTPPLYRIPVYTDDRGLRRSEDTRDAVLSKHHRILRKALVNKHFATVLFHPWILAEDPERMEHWQSWVRAAVNGGAKVGALEEFLPDGLPSQK